MGLSLNCFSRTILRAMPFAAVGVLVVSSPSRSSSVPERLLPFNASSAFVLPSNALRKAASRICQPVAGSSLSNPAGGGSSAGVFGFGAFFPRTLSVCTAVKVSSRKLSRKRSSSSRSSRVAGSVSSFIEKRTPPRAGRAGAVAGGRRSSSATTR